MTITLEEWCKENVPADEMVWKKAAHVQFDFFHRLTWAVCPPGADYKVYKTLKPIVISTHTSKSIRLPVVELRTPGGVVFTIRDNFHDYKVSVDSPVEIDVDFHDLFGKYAEESIHGVYFEGFPDERVFGAYADNKKQFSVELDRSEEVYMLLWLITRATSPQFS